ncbi:unnamed protein product [Polarella glacialis]|uniref:Tyr recombinase domain-containing protein n=1 Tax=Polarella glacialis TaxID=89957 RepID=A0A813G4L1_POLGL|nr:unnamed protein product [Polarella glacialis]
MTVEDPAAVACLHWLCGGKAEGEKLSSLSSNEFRGLWVKAIKALGLQDFHCPPYCLRRAGATRIFRLTRSLDVCCAIGGWQDIRTARIYVEDGLAVLARLTMPDRSATMLHDFAGPLRKRLEQVVKRMREK